MCINEGAETFLVIFCRFLNFGGKNFEIFKVPYLRHFSSDDQKKFIFRLSASYSFVWDENSFQIENFFFDIFFTPWRGHDLDIFSDKMAWRKVSSVPDLHNTLNGNEIERSVTKL
ncbi:hypothetical protein CI610_03085 [invertebrate metagenome]|uniref:Uncharacterized protein n=1 Tax=invertebrate metagenome TaxID=1711999 RepID=A0A2H9T449_9ZZZZ